MLARRIRVGLFLDFFSHSCDVCSPNRLLRHPWDEYGWRHEAKKHKCSIYLKRFFKLKERKLYLTKHFSSASIKISSKG